MVLFEKHLDASEVVMVYYYYHQPNHRPTRT